MSTYSQCHPYFIELIQLKSLVRRTYKNCLNLVKPNTFLLIFVLQEWRTNFKIPCSTHDILKVCFSKCWRWSWIYQLLLLLLLAKCSNKCWNKACLGRARNYLFLFANRLLAILSVLQIHEPYKTLSLWSVTVNST